MKKIFVVFCFSFYFSNAIAQQWIIVDIVSQNSKELVVMIDDGQGEIEREKIKKPLYCKPHQRLSRARVCLRKSNPRGRTGSQWQFALKQRQPDEQLWLYQFNLVEQQSNFTLV